MSVYDRNKLGDEIRNRVILGAHELVLEKDSLAESMSNALQPKWK